MITTLPDAHAMKPGSAGKPFFGVQPLLVDNEGHELEARPKAICASAASWPGQARTVYGDHDRFIETYFSHLTRASISPATAASAMPTTITGSPGRVDDVINVSGHRMGTAEVESALVLHPKVAEAAVVGYPHDVKGQGIYCYVTTMEGVEDVRRALRRS